MTKNTRRRPIVRLATMKRTVPTMLCAKGIGSIDPCRARLKMIDTMIQPMLSSMMAEARITWPTTRRTKFISRTTIATILTDAIESAVPRNSDVINRFCGSGNMPSGSISPSTKPQTKGMTMPISEANNEARPVCRTSLRSVSIPVSKSSSRIPNCEIASIIAFCSGVFGKSACRRSGRSRPNRDGPRIRPAIKLAHHGRLTKAQHRFAEQTTDHHQHDDLANENCFGCALAALGGPGRTSRQNGQGPEPNPVAGNLHDRSDAPGKAGRMPQGQLGTVACVGTAKPPRFADRPQIASRKSLTTRREFQRFRRQMQLQTICNKLY